VDRDPLEYEIRAGEAERLASATADLILREEILGLGRIYRDYAAHLRGSPVAAE
jgi:hypothetical protein